MISALPQVFLAIGWGEGMRSNHLLSSSKVKITAILLIAFILRLISLNQSFWLDEAITALQTRSSLTHYLTKFAPTDFHPPLHYLVVWSWSKLITPSEVSLRLISVAFSLISISLVYKIARHLDRKTALPAALLVATAPLHIYYSQEARMYMMATVLACLSILFFLKEEKRSNQKERLGFILATTSMVLTHYLTITLIPVFLFLTKKKRRTVVSLVVAALLSLVWLPIFSQQLGNGLATTGEKWADILGKPTFFNIALVPIKFILGRLDLINNFQYRLAVSLLIAAFGWLCAQALQRNTSKAIIPFVWLFIPFIGTLLLSFFIPVLSYFRLLFILPALYLLVALGIQAIYSKRLRKLALVSIVGINITASSLYLAQPRLHREDWRSAVQMVTNDPQGTAVFVFSEPPAPWLWYANPSYPVITTSTSSAWEITSNRLYVFEYLMDLTDPTRQVFHRLEQEGFALQKIVDLPGVGLIHVYQRQPTLALYAR